MNKVIISDEPVKKTQRQNSIKPCLSVSNLLRKKYKLLAFTGAWEQAFGQPERCGVWLIWGHSGSGKTTFVMQLMKYLSQFEKVYYNSLEESSSHTLQRAFVRAGMGEVGNRVKILEAENMQTLERRLLQKKSPNVIVIDSLQYTGLTFPRYQEFIRKFPKKLFIFTSQASGNLPATRTGVSVQFDASLKIWVEGFKAFSKGRYIGSRGEYTIWEEGADRYWLNQ